MNKARLVVGVGWLAAMLICFLKGEQAAQAGLTIPPGVPGCKACSCKVVTFWLDAGNTGILRGAFAPDGGDKAPYTTFNQAIPNINVAPDTCDNGQFNGDGQTWDKWAIRNANQVCIPPDPSLQGYPIHLTCPNNQLVTIAGTGQKGLTSHGICK